jgi:hypothetical protein
MSRIKSVSSIPVIVMVLTLGFLFSAGALGRPQEEPSGAAGRTVVLEIAVNLPDGTSFYIPAVGNGEMLGVIPFSKGRFAGIRITPSKNQDSVKIEVSALTTAKKKLTEATCDEIRSWNSEDVGSYEGKENGTLLLSGLARLGLPVFKVKIGRAGGPPPGWGLPNSARPSSVTDSFARCDCEYPQARSLPDGATGVGGIVSFPDAGKCSEVSGCGQCCRTSTPVGLNLVPPASINDPGPGEYGRMGEGLDESRKRCRADVYAIAPKTGGRRGGFGSGECWRSGGSIDSDGSERNWTNGGSCDRERTNSGPRSGDVCDSEWRSGSYTWTDLPIEIERGNHVWVEVCRRRIRKGRGDT